MAENIRALWALQLTSWVCFAAVGNTAAVMTEEALADREYVRRGDAAGLQGVNGKAYTAVPVDGDAPKVPVFHCAARKVIGCSASFCPAYVEQLMQSAEWPDWIKLKRSLDHSMQS